MPLDTVIGVYETGASPEEIVRRYDMLRLSDVFGAIGYYLAHRDEVDAYLAERHRFAAEVKAENQARFPTRGAREKLLARRQA